MARMVRMSDLDGFARSFLLDNYPSDGVTYEAEVGPEEEALIEKVTEPVEKAYKRRPLKQAEQVVSVFVRKPLSGGLLSKRKVH